MKLSDVFSSKGRVKIIETLVQSPRHELNISAIVSKIRLTHSSVVRHLKALISGGIVEQHKFGRIRIFRLKDENLQTRAIIKLIALFDRDGKCRA